MPSTLKILSPVENITFTPRNPLKVALGTPKLIDKSGSPNQPQRRSPTTNCGIPASHTHTVENTPPNRIKCHSNGLETRETLKAQRPDSNEGPTLPSGVPILQLQVDLITENVASRLAISLLGHVLFLKNQIPLPVPQLARLASTKSASSRGSKQRAELLSSFDTLASHLTSTFAALSLALYKSCSPEKLEKHNLVNGSLPECAYFAILLGPSLGTAKSKTFLAVDGFEAKIRELGEANNENDVKSVNTTDEGGSIDAVNPSDTEHESGAEEPPESEDESDEVDASSESESDEDLPPPPAPLQTQPRLSFVYRDPPLTPQVSSPSPQSSPPFANTSFKPRQPLRPSPLTPRQPLQTPFSKSRQIPQHSPLPSTPYAAEQRHLQNIERLLSRVLASADAEGYGFANEMTPTQTHVLIRAPRSFTHPAWIPRQNMTKSMDSSLNDFLAKSKAHNRESESNAKRPPKKKTQHASEGVWITPRSGSKIPECLGPQTEDEELIWWSWDGRIAGFSEW